MPYEWRKMGIVDFTFHWVDKDWDRLPIDKDEDFKIAIEEMMRTVCTPTIVINPKQRGSQTSEGIHLDDSRGTQFDDCW